MWHLLIGTGVGLFLLATNTGLADSVDGNDARVVAQLEELGIRVRTNHAGKVSHVGFPRGAGDELLRRASMYLLQLSPFKSLALSGADKSD